MKDIFWDNLLCVIDTETTGLNPDDHELVELAVIPLGRDIELHPHYGPVDLWIRPDNLDSVDPESLRITGKTLEERLQGIDSGTAADKFMEWHASLNLKPKSLIIPIAHNWAFDSQFIRNWLGRESFEKIFHGHARDTQSMGLTLNDLAWAYDHDLPYPRLGLRQMCTTAGIYIPPGGHGAMKDALMTKDLYKHLLFNRSLTRNQLGG